MFRTQFEKGIFVIRIFLLSRKTLRFFTFLMLLYHNRNWETDDYDGNMSVTVTNREDICIQAAIET